MSRTSLYQTIALIAAVLLLCLGVHFWLTDRKGVLQAFYPVPAALSALTTECSEGTPAWLESMMDQGTWELRALSSQSAYINKSGELHHCESGWRTRSIFSERVSWSTRFRYGSLTKPITSAALLALEQNGHMSVDDPVLGFLIEGDNALQDERVMKITAAQLMQHRAGVVGDVFTRKKKPWCPYDMSQLAEQKLSPTAFDQTTYSNLGFCILGEVIARQYEKDYRKSLEEQFDLKRRGIGFAEYDEAPDEVWHDYRYNDFYSQDFRADFDFIAVSSTAGMTGSASAYARLIRDILDENFRGYLSGSRESDNCDTSKIRSCYGMAFYLFQASNGEHLNIKEGYMPGSAGVAVVNEDREIFVWLGNSDTPNAATGLHMMNFINELTETGF